MEGLSAEESPASRKKQSGRQRSGAAERDAPDSLRRSGRQRRPSRHAPDASPQPRGASSSACTPGAFKAPGQRAGMAALHGAQPPQHTSGLSGTVPATPKRQEATAVLRGTWTHVGTPSSQGQAAGLEGCGAAAGTRRSKASEARHLAPAEPSAPAQPAPSAPAAAPASDAPTAEARQQIHVLDASIPGKPALRAEAGLKGLAMQSLSLPSMQAEGATSAVPAAELSLASRSPLSAVMATHPAPVLLGAGLMLSTHSGQAPQQAAGKAAEEGPLEEAQGAAPAQPHLADEVYSAELCMAARSGKAAQLSRQQAPDEPPGAPLQVLHIHAAVAAQPDAQQELSTEASMEAHCHEPVQEPEHMAAGRPSEGAQVRPDAPATAAARHGAEQSFSADATVMPESDNAVQRPEQQGAQDPPEQPHQKNTVSFPEVPACLPPQPAAVVGSAHLEAAVLEEGDQDAAESASSGRLMLSTRSGRGQETPNQEAAERPLQALPDSFTAQLPASGRFERTFTRRQSVALSDRSASKSRLPSITPAGGATLDEGRPALALGTDTSAAKSPCQPTERPSDAAPSAPIPDSAPWHGARSRPADEAAPASPESHSAPAQQPEGIAGKGSAAASELQECHLRPRDTGTCRSSGQPSAKRIQPIKPGKRSAAAAGARTAAGRQQAIKNGLGCSRCRFARKGCSKCRRQPAAAARQKMAEQASKPSVAPAHATAAQPKPELHSKVGTRADQAYGYQPDGRMHIMY